MLTDTLESECRFRAKPPSMSLESTALPLSYRPEDPAGKLRTQDARVPPTGNTTNQRIPVVKKQPRQRRRWVGRKKNPGSPSGLSGVSCLGSLVFGPGPPGILVDRYVNSLPFRWRTGVCAGAIVRDAHDITGACRMDMAYAPQSFLTMGVLRNMRESIVRAWKNASLFTRTQESDRVYRS